MASILFINRVYPPAEGATGEMLRDLAEGLAKRGWDVQVLVSSLPHEPAQSTRNGVVITRTGLAISKKNLILRAIGYAAIFPAFFIKALRLPRTDFVVTMTDPPMLAVIGPIIAHFKKNQAIHWAQDIYPEVAEELGVLAKGGLLANILRSISTSTLKRYHAVISLGRCMAERLRHRGVPENKIHRIPNWAPPIFSIEKNRNPFRKINALEGDFVVAYSGNMGMAHEFDAILDAAESLRGHPIVFLMIGGGPRKSEIQSEAIRRNLTNLRFLPHQPKESLSESLSAADAHLVSMKLALCGLVVPSKFYGVLAAGRPCLFIGPPDSEIAQILVESEAGLVLDPTKPANLAGAILDWTYDTAAHAAACRRARITSSTEGREDAIQRFEKLLNTLLQK
jgi:glycosyltransferase involved in cell wall biosynthesis